MATSIFLSFFADGVLILKAEQEPFWKSAWFFSPFADVGKQTTWLCTIPGAKKPPGLPQLGSCRHKVVLR